MQIVARTKIPKVDIVWLLAKQALLVWKSRFLETAKIFTSYVRIPSAINNPEFLSMKAPALEKGLIILEKLVLENEPLTLTQIAKRCELSVSEIQRMVHVLHQRGYLQRNESGAYTLGMKCYELGRIRYPFRHLQVISEPILANLADKIGHSVHLSVEDRGQALVLTELLGSGFGAVSVKADTRLPLSECLSGRILLMNYAGRARQADIGKIKKQNYLSVPSHIYDGVRDIGVPMRRIGSDAVIAVIACCCLKMKDSPIDDESIAAAMHEAADEIVQKL